MTEQKSQVLKIDYILNAPILTNWGVYEYCLYSHKTGNLKLSNAISAVGHASTAKLMSKLLNYPIKVNRIKIQMKVGETALVFSLKDRQPEGIVLSLKDIKKLKYKLGILKRVK